MCPGVPSDSTKDLFRDPYTQDHVEREIMGTSLDKIDDMIAYIESPEYLRMVANAQGESAYALLGRESYTPEPSAPPVESGHAITGYVPLNEWEAPTPRQSRPRPANQLTTRDAWWKFGECLGSRIPFKTYGKLFGTDVPKSDPGRLPTAYAELYASELPFIDYVVYSHWTPIAWHVWNPGITGVTDAESYWVFPQTRYSVTTSRYQNKIRTALTESGEDVRP